LLLLLHHRLKLFVESLLLAEGFAGGGELRCQGIFIGAVLHHCGARLEHGCSRLAGGVFGIGLLLEQLAAAVFDFVELPVFAGGQAADCGTA